MTVTDAPETPGAGELEALRTELARLRLALDVRVAREALPERFDGVLCRVGERWLAVPLAQVLEVLPRLPLLALPSAPAHVAGYTRFRGAHVPVLELGLALEGQALPTLLEDRVLLVKTSAGEVRGLLLNEVEGVVPLERAALAPVPPDAPGSAWALGFAALGDRSLLVLSADELLRPLAGVAIADPKGLAP